MNSDFDVTAEVRALDGLDLGGLRDVWQRRIGPPPPLRSPEMLRMFLAYRLQAQAHGGLTASARRRLRGGAPAGTSDHVTQGVRLVRTWRGEAYEVLRAEAGYLWNEKVYASLSAVALAITGVKRNGPRFFGLRDEEGRV